MDTEFYVVYQMSYPLWGYLLIIISVGLFYFSIKLKDMKPFFFAIIFLGAWGVLTYKYINHQYSYTLGEMKLVVDEVRKFMPFSKVSRRYSEQFSVGAVNFSHTLSSSSCLGANEIDIKNGDYVRVNYIENEDGLLCILKIEKSIKGNMGQAKIYH